MCTCARVCVSCRVDVVEGCQEWFLIIGQTRGTSVHCKTGLDNDNEYSVKGLILRKEGYL